MNNVLNNSCIDQKIDFDGFVIADSIKNVVSNHSSWIYKLNYIMKPTVHKDSTKRISVSKVVESLVVFDSFDQI